jgi:DNA-binding response OmpR family regulator
MTKRILIVDDEENIRWFVSQGLNKTEYVVDTAFDGESALEMIGRSIYDVIVTDYQMPGINGIELIRIIRDRSPRTAVILMTGLEDKRLKQDSGADIFLQKPFPIRMLKEALDELDGGLGIKP